MSVHRPPAPVVAVLALLLVLTVAATVATARLVERREDQELDQRAQEAALAIDRRVDAYAEQLYALRGLLTPDPRAVDPAAYAQFFAGQELFGRLPGVTSIAYVTRVPADEREQFVARTRRRLRESGLPYPPFRIQRSARRPVHAFLTYIAPLIGGNPDALGLDLLAEPTRRDALRRAIATNRPAASGPLTLVQDSSRGQVSVPGFVIDLPIYRDGIDPGPARRSAAWVGATHAAFRAEQLVRGAVTATRGFDLEVHDAGRIDRPAASAPRVPLFNAEGRPDDAFRGEREGRVRPLSVAGRRWLVFYASDEALLGTGVLVLPWAVGALGLLVSLLAAGVVWSVSTSRARAVALADRMTRDLRESRNELARSNHDLEQFAFLASHDLQQPLRTVRGFLQLLERRHARELDDGARDMIGHAIAGTGQMGTLIDDLLAYSRAGRPGDPLALVDLDAAWDEAVGQLGAAIDETGAEVTRGDLPRIAGDQRQLVQVFANLVGNAIKYRSAAPPVVHAEAEATADGWRVVVADNGMGIEPPDHERVFGMFRRLPGSSTVAGTGVGLAIVRKVVERAGGRVHVESQGAGRGTRFVLSFPVPDADLADARPAARVEA